MARFFIDRPVFAWVIAIIIMLAGGISILSLPISQYPSIAPPTIGITAQYPGASAQTVQDTVTQVIEQNMNGLDYLLYMSSTSDSSGQAQITLTFSADANPDIAQVQVQNKLQLATPLLPQEVQRQGISVAKRGANFLKVYAFVSEDGSMDNADIADYVATNLKDAISRISGVGEVSLFGSQYGMGSALQVSGQVNPAAIHRIAVSAATTFDPLPHSPMLAQGMAVFKTNMKESYKYSFILTVVFPVIFSLVAVVGAIIFY